MEKGRTKHAGFIPQPTCSLEVRLRAVGKVDFPFGSQAHRQTIVLRTRPLLLASIQRLGVTTLGSWFSTDAHTGPFSEKDRGRRSGQDICFPMLPTTKHHRLTDFPQHSLLLELCRPAASWATGDAGTYPFPCQ